MSKNLVSSGNSKVLMRIAPELFSGNIRRVSLKKSIISQNHILSFEVSKLTPSIFSREPRLSCLSLTLVSIQHERSKKWHSNFLKTQTTTCGGKSFFFHDIVFGNCPEKLKLSKTFPDDKMSGHVIQVDPKAISVPHHPVRIYFGSCLKK